MHRCVHPVHHLRALGFSGRSSSIVETVSFSLTMGITPSREQRPQGCAQVFVPERVAKIILGEEHLRDAASETVERIVVERHQPRLANRGAGLHLFERRRAFRQTESLDAKTDRTGATTRTSTPRLRSAAICSTRPQSRPSATLPSERMMTLVPSFTTMRRIASSSYACAAATAGVMLRSTTGASLRRAR